ncbi:alpha-ribazole phosphatase [Desulfosporosinus fructosivorans]|uniref:Alpha-ribazole phosphatase n=1 Tax=Desulfosporosinus fructosivorans TaxID=2018669 RepID=A0A4Z0R476_9FIRM|nr:alpha-ribazole phosphatase [Desulfosporosinus fructosivorans]TGE37600.1 alpha-ribazole phosphatase [Desulfosporosinus fructosivorans]
MDKKHIYLARHGDIGLGREKRYIGQSDLSLSALGEQQASLLKEIFSRVPLDNIYCSDLGRAQQTADIIASAHQILPMARVELRELNMGTWEGKTFSEIRAEYPKEFKNRGEDIANYSPPRGESFYDCYKRVIPVFESLTKSDESTILIVGHAGLNRVILCRVLGIPLENVFRLEQSYGCYNLISQEGLEYRLKYLNQTVNNDLYKMD